MIYIQFNPEEKIIEFVMSDKKERRLIDMTLKIVHE